MTRSSCGIPERATELAALPGPAGRVQGAQVSPDGTTLYTAAIGGELLAWDLTGKRSFGRSTRLGAARRCCDPLSPHAPPLAVSGDGSRFAVQIGTSTVGGSQPGRFGGLRPSPSPRGVTRSLRSRGRPPTQRLLSARTAGSSSCGALVARRTSPGHCLASNRPSACTRRFNRLPSRRTGRNSPRRPE